MSLLTQWKNIVDEDTKQVTLERNSLDGTLTALLTSYYFMVGNILKINSSSSTAGEHVVTVKGTSSFLNIPDLPVEAVFEENDAGGVKNTVVYTLIAPQQSSAQWTFAKSFPDMPVTERYSELNDTFSYTSILDEYKIREAYVVVTDTARTESVWGVPLQKGINLVAKVYPEGLLGILSDFAEKNTFLTLYGVIRVPVDDTELFTPDLLKRLDAAKVYPWDVADELPGIHLQVDFGHDVSIGNAKIENTKIRLYSPLSTSWSNYGPLFTPVKAFTGELNIPSAGIRMEAIAALDNALSGMFIETRFSGVSLGNLLALGDVTGKTNLLGNLPESLQESFGALKKIELQDFAMGISWSNKKFGITTVMMKIGTQNLDWTIWEDHLQVRDISLRFEVSSPLRSPTIGIQLYGKIELEGVPLEIIGTKYGKEYTLLARLGSEQTLPLNKLMQRFVPDLPAPSDLTINGLSVEVSPGNYCRLVGTIASVPKPWVIDLGPGKLKVQNIEFDLKALTAKKCAAIAKQSGVAKVPRFSGFFGGEVLIDDVRLALNYTLPGDFIIRADVGLIKLSSMYRNLTGNRLPGPENFDFELKDTSILIKKTSAGFVFQAMTMLSGVGLLAFEVGRIKTSPQAKTGVWGGAVGVSLTQPKLSKLPGCSFLAPIEKTVKLQNVMLVVSSYESVNFRFPEVASFSNPALNSTGIKHPEISTGITKGFNASAQWILNTKSKEQKLLRKVFGLDPTMNAQLQIDLKQPKTPVVSFFTSITTTFSGNPLKAMVGIKMATGRQPEFFMLGSSQFKIGKRNYAADIGASVVATGMSIAGTLKGTIAVKGMKLSNLSIMGSINWAGVPGIGFAGSLDFPSFHASIAMLVDSASGGFVFAGAVSEITAYQVVTDVAKVSNLDAGVAAVLKKIALQGTKSFNLPKNVAASLDGGDVAAVSEAFGKHGKLSIPASELQTLLVQSTKGKKWQLTDQVDNMKHYEITMRKNDIRVVVAPQIYVCPTYARIGSLEFAQGFFLSAAIKIMDLVAYASVNVNPNKGIAIEAYINKPVIISNRNFFCLSSVDRKKGPYLSVCTYNQPGQKKKEFKKPHCYLDGRLSLIGLDISCLAMISAKGMDVAVSTSITAKFNLDVIRGRASVAWNFRLLIGNINNFRCSFTNTMKLNAAFYLAGQKVASFNPSITGTIVVGFNGKKAYASYKASTSVIGRRCTISLSLNVSGKDLKKIDKLVLKEIGDFFEDIYKDVNKFLDDVGKGVVKGFNDAGKLATVLEKRFNQNAKQVVKTFDKMGRSVDDIGKALDKTFRLKPDDAAKVLKQMGKPSKYIAGALKNGFKIKPDDLGKALKSVGSTDKTVKNAMKDVGVAAKDVEKFAKNVLGDVGSETKKFFGKIGIHF